MIVFNQARAAEGTWPPFRTHPLAGAHAQIFAHRPEKEGSLGEFLQLGRYVGLEASMDLLAEVCRRERPDGIAGYSNDGGMALLVAAAREAGHDAFQSIRFVMSFAGATSPTMQRHIREALGPEQTRISMPTLMFGSQCDPMLANAQQMAGDVFERCELAVADERRPFANHALPEKAEPDEPAVKFLAAQQT